MEGSAGPVSAARRARLAFPVSASLETRGVEYIRFALAHPSHYRVMFGAEIPDRAEHPGLAAAADAAFAGLAVAVEEAPRAGRLRPGDAGDTARVCWALVHGLADLLVAGQLKAAARSAAEIEWLARAMTRALLDGLLDRPPVGR